MTSKRRKTKKSHVEDEQLIVRGVIVSKEFTEQIKPLYDGNFISCSQWGMDKGPEIETPDRDPITPPGNRNTFSDWLDQRGGIRVCPMSYEVRMLAKWIEETR